MPPDQYWLATGNMHLQRSRECVLDVARQIGGAEPSSVTLTDLSRFGNDGAMTGVTWSQLASGLWVMGYDGNDYVRFTDVPSLQMLDNFSVAIWVQTTVNGFYLGVISRNNNINGWSLVKTDINTFSGYFISATVGDYFHSNLAYTDSNWHFLVITIDAGTGRLYVDGPLQIDKTTQAIGDSGDSVYLGRFYDYTTSLSWQGNLALSRIYNYALAPATILAHYKYEKGLFGL